MSIADRRIMKAKREIPFCYIKVYLISDALVIQLFGEINLKVGLIGEVAVAVQVDSLIAVSVVHRDEVMAEHTSPCCSVFQRDADVIVV